MAGYKNGNQDDGRSVTLTTFPMLSYFDVKKDIKSLIYMRTKYQHEPCGENVAEAINSLIVEMGKLKDI